MQCNNHQKKTLLWSLCAFSHCWVAACAMPQVAVCAVECMSLHLLSPRGGAVHGQLAEQDWDRGLDRLDKQWDVRTSRRHG